MTAIPTSGSFLTADTEIWHNLKFAIAGSTGFLRWELETMQRDMSFNNLSLDQKVQRYLRETLETLAY